MKTRGTSQFWKINDPSLRYLWARCIGHREIALRLGTTEGTVRSRASYLGLGKRPELYRWSRKSAS